jgi:hypothetical protein
MLVEAIGERWSKMNMLRQLGVRGDWQAEYQLYVGEYCIEPI